VLDSREYICTKFFNKKNHLVNNFIKPALSLLEFSSIATGIIVTDEMIKKAEIEVLESTAVCPGKYLVLIVGEEGPVEESFKKGKEISEGWIVDELFIPNIHRQVIPAISATTEIKELKSIGIIETFSVASTIVSADQAVKNSDIKLIEIRLAKGIGGKAYYTFTGELEDVEAGMIAGSKYPESVGFLVNKIIIPNPDKTTYEFIL
jgi:microcompartment protein CcmL/EutN